MLAAGQGAYVLAGGLDLLDIGSVGRFLQAVDAPVQRQRKAPPHNIHAHGDLAAPVLAIGALYEPVSPRAFEHTLQQSAPALQIAALVIELGQSPHIDAQRAFHIRRPLPRPLARPLL